MEKDLTKTQEDLIKAFSAIEQHDLEVNTIICTVCGCVVNFEEKTPICEHLIEMVQGFEDA